MKQREFPIRTENDKNLAKQVHRAGNKLLAEAKVCYAVDLMELAVYRTTSFKLIHECGKQLINTNFN